MRRKNDTAFKGPWVSLALWADWLIAEQARTGLSWAVFAARLGITSRRLYAWRNKKGAMVRLQMVEDALWTYNYLTFETTIGGTIHDAHPSVAGRFHGSETKTMFHPGLACRECGGRTRINSTRTLPTYKRRRHQCMSCGARFTTREETK